MEILRVFKVHQIDMGQLLKNVTEHKKGLFKANLGPKHGIYGSHVSLHLSLDLQDLVGRTFVQRNNMDSY